MMGVKETSKQGGRGWRGRGWRGRGFRSEQTSRRPGEEAATSPSVQSSQNNARKPTTTESDKVQYLVKYSYQANAKSPLGLAELTIKQGQKVTFIKKHSENDQWSCVQGDDGQEGYVPSSYVMELESKPSTLPWLQNSKDMEEKTEDKWGDCGSSKPIFKPYKPTYRENEYDVPKELNPYYCKICDKKLNGISPYNAHMASKAHKEEVKYLEEVGNQ
ncbi:uncharacterized protein [Antedon mediterranea]|uniref:uncharacterized protein isoform X2 n=1 Tax=Antedon mediterranea TaxID=105859 RepID=UPI003AF81B2B